MVAGPISSLDELRAALAEAEAELAAVPELNAQIKELNGHLERSRAHGANLQIQIDDLQRRLVEAQTSRIMPRQLQHMVKSRLKTVAKRDPRTEALALRVRGLVGKARNR